MSSIFERKEDESWDEADVELAERYASALKEIKDLLEDVKFDETDIELAERYAEAINTIYERK